MQAVVDSSGRIVIPKPLRDALGLTPGSTVELSRSGAGLHLVPAGSPARLVEEDGVVVVTGVASIDDEAVLALRALRGTAEATADAELAAQPPRPA